MIAWSLFNHFTGDGDIIFVSHHLKSQITWLFIQQVVQQTAQIEIKAPYNWPFVREIHLWWIPLTKGQ